MQNVIFLVGLPGSGITTFAKEYFPSSIYIDNISDFQSLHSKKHYITVVVSHHNLCFSEVRESAELKIKQHFPGTNIHHVNFSSTPALCINNVAKRDDKRVISSSYIREVSNRYKPHIGKNSHYVYCHNSSGWQYS